MQEKKNGGLITIIIMLVVIIIALGCVVGYMLLNNKDNKTSNTNENTEVKEENSKFAEVAKNVIGNKIVDIMSISACGGGRKYDFDSKNEITYNDLTEEDRINMVYHYLYGNAFFESLYSEALINGYEKVFGIKDYKLPEKIGIYSQFANYENNNGWYQLVANGGGCMSTYHYAMDEITVKDNKIYVDVIYYINEVDVEYGGKEYLTDSFENANVRLEISDKLTNEQKIDKVKENKDKFPKYRFVFKLTDNNYIFDSIQKI